MKGNNTMKIINIILAIAACTLLLSGCAQNSGAAASSTTTAVSTTSASTVPSETITTEAVTTTTPITEAASAPDLSTQTRLFRGYVETDKEAEYLFGAPDESSEQLSELTYGTLLEIYTCDHNGWYLAELGGEKVGYVKADVIKEYPHKYPFGDPLFGGYVASDSAINLYSEPDESSDVIRQIEGWTQISIYESEVEGWYVTALAKTDDSGEYDVGYVKAEYIAEIPDYNMEATESKPNEYGFYELQDPPVSGISIAALSGTWYNPDKPNEQIMITNDGDLYSGSFTFTEENSDTINGSVRLEYGLNPDETRTYWYTFYKNDGTLWNAFGADGVIPLSDLYAGQSGEPHFVRAS